MQIEYAKELVAVDCERLLGTIETLGKHKDALNAEEQASMDNLALWAGNALTVFRHPEGGVK